MADTIQRFLRLAHATTPRLCTTTTLGALGTAYLLFKWGVSMSRKTVTARCSFDTLPLDVLLEIFTYLDCVDVVRVRRVCWSLCNATKARPVWLRLFHLDALDSGHRRIYLDRTLESHSATELEAAVLRPYKGDFWWTNRDPHTRKIGISNEHEILRVLPGGRWWLARSVSKSSVVCYDFSDTGRDSDEAPYIPLASNPLPLLPGTHFRSGPVIDVDIDTTTPYLTFHLAVYFTRSDLDGIIDDAIGGHHPILQIWKVTPCFDTNGRIHRLAARHLRTFHRETYGRPGFLQIRGQCIALREGSYSHVFDWANTPADIDASLPLKWGEDNNFQYRVSVGSLFALLPDRRVILYCADEISIGYLPCSVPPSRRSSMPRLPILWTAKIPFCFLAHNPGIYGPFLSPTHADVFTLVGPREAPSVLLTIPKNFTSATDHYQPRVDIVASLSKPLGATIHKAWSARRFAFLHQMDKEPKRLLLRRGRVPYPPSPPMVDVAHDDFVISIQDLRIGGYNFSGPIMFDEYSSLIGAQLNTQARSSVLLFEPLLN